MAARIWGPRRTRAVDEWESDETDTWRAIVGTALHEWITGVRYEACLATGLNASFEVPVSYGGVPGHADEVIWTTGEVTDYKGIALTTPIPTPSGWTTMGAVQPGDEVFGSDGRPCQVVVKSAPKQIGTYVVRFKDGASVVCDREHLWWAMRGQGVRGHLEVACIEEMAASVMSRGQVNWRVPVAGPLMLPDADLPLSPYVLGCWLGDGSLGEGRICKHPQLFAEIKREGFPAGRIPPSQQGRVVAVRTLSGLRAKLRDAGVLNDKHVPAAYLRASLPQRIALVQGLMDTDGSWNKPRRRAVFTTTSKALAAAMAELLASSGEKPVTWWGKSRGSGLLVDYCHVEWTPTRFVPFRTPVKASLVSVPGPAKLARARWRTISEITAGPDVATACIAVNSRNLTYLCGPEITLLACWPLMTGGWPPGTCSSGYWSCP